MGGSEMAFWSIDLTTQDGAEGAAGLGGIACFVYAGLCVLGMVFVAMFGTYSGARAIGALVGSGAETALFLLAGWRLRNGKGLVSGSIAALLLLLETILKLASLSIGGVILNAVLLVVLANGLRAALALKKGISDPDAVADVFN
jgi:hypothetical protein